MSSEDNAEQHPRRSSRIAERSASQSRSSSPLSNAPTEASARSTSRQSPLPTPPVSTVGQALPPLQVQLDPIAERLSEESAPASAASNMSVGGNVGNVGGPNPPGGPQVGLSTVTDVVKMFDGIDKLSNAREWPMWSYRIKSALTLIWPTWSSTRENPPSDVMRNLLLHQVTQRVANEVMVHYITTTTVQDLMDGLGKRFDPQTTTTEANDIHALFQLRRPVWEFDKLLDDVERFHDRIITKGQNFPDDVYYSALIGMIPPQYRHVQSAYENRQRQAAKSASTATQTVAPSFIPSDLILELRNEFTNYRATHPPIARGGHHTAPSSSRGQSTRGRGSFRGRTFKTRGARANAATPYPKTSPPQTQRKLTCFNCNAEGHQTPDCPKPWTAKSKAAMLKKGITHQKQNATMIALASEAETATACASQTTTTTDINAENDILALATAQADAQSDWVNSVSASDVTMTDATSVSIDYLTAPVFTALTSPNILHLIDSGATMHCTPYMSRLFNVHAASPLNIMVANSTVMTAKLKGDMAINLVAEDGAVSTLTLSNVYYCAQMPFTLLSVSLLKSHHIHFNSGTCTIADSTQRKLSSICERNHLYYVEECYANAAQSTISLFDLHKRMGHISYSYLKKLIKSSPEILTLKVNDFTETQCQDCILNNIHRTAISKQRTSKLASNFGDHFHIDIFGPLRTAAIGGYQYWLTIVDDATRWVTIAPLRHKDDALTQWVNFTTELFTQYGIKVKLLQSDNDAVFTSSEFTRYLQAQGTVPRRTIHDTPQQNGVAERTHQTLMNHVRVNLFSARLADKFWLYAVQYAAYCMNRSPRAAINFQTPYYKRYNTHYNLDNMRPFGAPCIVYDETQSNKLHPRGNKAVWLGFAEHAKGHLVWLGHRVSTERNVQFVDNMSQIEGEQQLPNNLQPQTETENPNTNAQTNDVPMDVDEPTTTTPPLRRSERQRTSTRKARGLDYDEVDVNLAFYLTEFNAYYAEDVGDPIQFKDVLEHPLKDDWFASMREEVKTLEQRNTWSYVFPPPNANIIGTRFVYKTKEEHGQKKRMKSRLVVQGFAQKEGFDYYSNDLFAPVARLSSMRTILAWAATNDFEITQIDVKSAYLYGNLNQDEEIYVRPPPGNLLPNLRPGQVLKLNKALYGLKQAGRRWYKTLSQILASLNLTKSEYDNAVFYRRYQGRLILVLFVHVDDITLCGVDTATITAFKSALTKHVAFTDGGELHWLLGIEIKRNRKEKLLMMRQKHYIDAIIKRYGFSQEHNRRAPMQTGLILSPKTSQLDEEKRFMESIPYKSLVGGLRYAADCTRPDIAYCTGQLARYLNEPSREHYEATKHCYQYLKGTADYWLTLGGTNSTQLIGFADSDGMTTSGNKPIMGYLFKLGNSLISWSSKRATLVTLSVTEAELCALVHASQEAISLKNFVNEVLQTSLAPTTIYTDSASAIAIIKSPEEERTQRTKHFNIRKNFFADRIDKGYLQLEHISTNEQQADLLTKALSADKVKRFMQLLRLSA